MNIAAIAEPMTNPLIPNTAMPPRVVNITTKSGIRASLPTGSAALTSRNQNARPPKRALHRPDRQLSLRARDDGFRTFACAAYIASWIVNAKFIGYEQGGRLWVGHEKEIRQEILKLLGQAPVGSR
jgi:hypothetical protein